MVRSFDEALPILYRAAFATFVAERKQLAGELKAAGDKAGALRLGKVTRPTLSAWTVNQLWWTAPEDFEALLAAAQRLREGDLSASDARREVIGRLRERASVLLAQAGQGASEVTLRRIATTLAALAAAGGFAPDPPGQLAADRDPPGFESAGGLERAVLRSLTPARTREVDEARRQQEASEARRKRDEAAAREREAATERRRLEEERVRQRAERERLERSLRSLRSELERRGREVERMRGELAEAESELENARSSVSQIEARLAALREGK